MNTPSYLEILVGAAARILIRCSTRVRRDTLLVTSGNCATWSHSVVGDVG